MRKIRSGDEPDREGRWFFWLLAVLALVVAADSLHVLPGSDDPAVRRPRADVLGRVITRDTVSSVPETQAPVSTAAQPVPTTAPSSVLQAPATVPAVTEPVSAVPVTQAPVSRTAQQVPTTRARVTATTRAPTTTTVEEVTNTTSPAPPDPPATVSPEP